MTEWIKKVNNKIIFHRSEKLGFNSERQILTSTNDLQNILKGDNRRQ